MSGRTPVSWFLYGTVQSVRFPELLIWVRFLSGTGSTDSVPFLETILKNRNRTDENRGFDSIGLVIGISVVAGRKVDTFFPQLISW